MLPTDSKLRKEAPMFSGVLQYFPDAIFAVARLSYLGNEKHNPGEPLHWAKEKSGDEPDCIMRHLADHGVIDPDDGALHEVKLAWRGLANLQRFIDKHGIEACFDETIIAKVRAQREDKRIVIAKATVIHNEPVAPRDEPSATFGPRPHELPPVAPEYVEADLRPAAPLVGSGPQPIGSVLHDNL